MATVEAPLPVKTQEPPRRDSLIQSGRRGVELKTLEEMFRFAQYVSTSGLAPKGIESPAAILVALQMGAEVGLTPMASLQNIAVVNGRPSIWGDAMLAVCRGSGMFDEQAFEEKWYDESGKELKVHQREKAYAATCAVRRLPDGKLIEGAFNLAQAKEAGLTAKGGPWKTYPARMLQMRARSFALRDGFSDVLRGFKSTEEVQDMVDVEVTAPPAARKLADLTDRIMGAKEPTSTAEALAQSQGMAPGEVPLDTADDEADESASLSQSQAADTVEDSIRFEIARAANVTECNKISGQYKRDDVTALCNLRSAEIQSTRGPRSKQKDAFENGQEGVGQ